MVAGYNYTLVMNEQGRLFSFGDGEQGCLGHGNKDNMLLPQRVAALRRRVARLSRTLLWGRIVPWC